MPPASVVMMCGLPASGKTTTAGRLHAYAGGVLIRSCDVYADLGIRLPDWVVRTRGFTVNVHEYDQVRDRAYEEIARRLERNLAGAGPMRLRFVSTSICPAGTWGCCVRYQSRKADRVSTSACNVACCTIDTSPRGFPANGSRTG